MSYADHAHHQQPGRSKPIPAGPTTAATSFSPWKSETFPALTAICSRISTGSTPIRAQLSMSPDRTMEQRLHRPRRALCHRPPTRVADLRAPRHRSPNVLGRQALRLAPSHLRLAGHVRQHFRRQRTRRKSRSSIRRSASPKKSISPTAPTNSIRPSPSRNSTNSSPSAIFPRGSLTSGRPTTAPPSKAC